MEDASGASSFISEENDGSATSAAVISSGAMRNEDSQNSQLADNANSSTNQQTSTNTTEFAAPAPLSISFQKKSTKIAKNNESETQKETSSSSSSDSIIGPESSSDISKEHSKSHASTKKIQQPQSPGPFPYKEPDWGSAPDIDTYYSFDVLKEGKIINSVPLVGKSFHVFGRLPSCDVTLEHPTLSRYHAVMQFTKGCDEYEAGWYIYDLDSTHGTWVNKRKIPPNVYLRINVGHVIKFGGSTRLHILQGPDSDQEEESELSFAEMKEGRERLKKEAELVKQMDLQVELQRQAAEQKMLQDRGCSWGMGEDAVEEEVDATPFVNLTAENESLYIDDPKKALKGFYEREGCDLPDYQFVEAGIGKHKCILNLPVDGPNGEELVSEAVVSGKRKDAVVACALEACRILDKLGMLRSATHESRKRKQKKWEDNDFYDSDEDTFLDRTGIIEKKRAVRMKKAGKQQTETYESLMEKYTKVTKEMKEVEAKLAKAKADAEQAQSGEDQDELEAYMNSIKAGAMDPKTRIRLKAELMKLKAEESRLRKLVNIAKPASLPPLKPSLTETKSPSSIDSLTRKIHSHQKASKKTAVAIKSQQYEEKPDNFEEEEEEDDKKDMDTEQAPRHKQPPPGQTRPSSADCEARLTAPEPARQTHGPQPGTVKGPFMPPSMLEALAKGKSSAEAFITAQKELSSRESSSTNTENPD